MSTPSGGTVVVGAAQGIGAATARLLATEPWAGRLVLGDRQVDKIDALARDLAELGLNVAAHPVDLARDGSIAEFARAAGHIDRVAIVAGIMVRHDALSMTHAEFDTALRVNLIGPYLLAQAFAGPMVERGSGAIVAVTSTGGRMPARDIAAYCASKAGLAIALRVLALATAPHGVRLNTVAPGATDTEMLQTHRVRQGLPPANEDPTLKTRLPRGRINSPREVAALVSFLLSPESEAIVMQEIVIDGGQMFGRT